MFGGYLREIPGKTFGPKGMKLLGGLRKSKNKKFLCDSIHEIVGIYRRMEDPRNAHTILTGGFEEQKFKSNTKHIYKHYIKTNLVGKLFSK